MLVYLDTVICIYVVEGATVLQARARAKLATLLAAGDRFAVSDLTWLECRVKPIELNDVVALANREAFLTGPAVVRVQLPSAVYERACQIRARQKYELADALHLAAAVESGCGSFLTNDLRLSNFSDISVELLS